MARHELIVIGAGISGASLAFHAARSGRRVLVLEKDDRAGGCLHSVRTPSGYWFELGAHTCYNSYGGLLEILEACGLLGELQPRGKPVLRFLDGDRCLPGKNLGLLLRRFRKLELLRAVPRWFGADAAGKTVREHYARLVGEHNYARVLGPMLSAVPSQPVDGFPADLLFKKRERRKDVLRSFTLPGGLQTVVEAILGREGVELRSGCGVAELARAGRGFEVRLEGGVSLEAEAIALATPPGIAAGLLSSVAPAVAEAARGIAEARVDSLGFAVRAAKTSVPASTFLIPLADRFHSVVTRDVVPDPERRGFTFHFHPGLEPEQRVRRACEVLGLQPQDLECASERRTVLPSPALGHAERVASVDAALRGERIAVTGNWFAGLSIEDCVLRSREEWRRLEAV